VGLRLCALPPLQAQATHHTPVCLPLASPQGNAAFSAGKLDEAVKLFTQCIELDGSNHIYHSNRAAAHTGLKDYKAAVRDARWALGWGQLCAGAAFVAPIVCNSAWAILLRSGLCKIA